MEEKAENNAGVLAITYVRTCIPLTHVGILIHVDMRVS